MRGTRATALALAILTLTSCGSSEADRSPTQVLQDASSAVKGVGTFHVAGSGNTGNGTTSFDFHIGGPQRATGSITLGDVKADLILAGGVVYLRGQQFFSQFGSPEAAQLIGDSWVQLPAADATSTFAGFAVLLDTKKLGDCFTSTGLSFSKSTTTVDGRSAVELRSPNLTVDVADSGPAYPSAKGSSGGLGACLSGGTLPGLSSNGGSATASFDSWGSPVAVSPPPHAMDLSSILGG